MLASTRVGTGILTRIYHATTTDGGITIYPDGTVPTEGYAVGLNRDAARRVVPVQRFRDRGLSILQDWLATVGLRNVLRGEGAAIGTWYERASGLVWLEPSLVLADWPSARDAALMECQRYVFDLAAGDTLPVCEVRPCVNP
ncbi:MAG: hypothetical protein AB7Q01_08585 [Gammaproteobacteria bacterium]